MKQNRLQELDPEAGQITVEIVLMLVVTVGIILAVSTAARKNQWLADLVSGPWNDLASIIQNGVPLAPGQTVMQMASEHPESWSRVSSPKITGYPIN